MANFDGSSASSPDTLLNYQNQQSEALRRQKHNAKLLSDSRSAVLNMSERQAQTPRWAQNNSASQADAENEPEEAMDNSDSGDDFRENVQRAKKAKIKNSSNGAGVASSVGTGASEILVQAWLNSIETFGLTILYVNIHVFLGFVLGHKYFCKLGHEWSGQIPEAKVILDRLDNGDSAISKNMDDIGRVEVMLLVLVDLIALFLLLIIIVLIMFTVGSLNWLVSGFLNFFGLS